MYSPCITDDQVKLQGDFQFIMGVLSVIGHDPTTLTDCSEVLPVPPVVALNAHFPAGVTISDVQQAVSIRSFPQLSRTWLTYILTVQLYSLPGPPYQPRPGYRCPSCVSTRT